MQKLIREEFNSKFRFRKSRGSETELNCTSCENMNGEVGYGTEAYCTNDQRVRKIRLSEPGFSDWNLAGESICDAYISKPLPEGIHVPDLPDRKAFILGTQWRGLYHEDRNCPYVIEEVRRINIENGEGKNKFNKPKIELEDLSELVPGETIGRQICEMPCCESKLPYFTWRIDDYRRLVGIKPDGTEPRVWVRNNIKNHQKKVDMTIEEAGAIFDLSRFNSSDYGDIHSRICAVSDHLHKYCNALGSRPLSKAQNPISLWVAQSILESSLIGENSHADFWIYDERLFNKKRGLEKPLVELSMVPEGIYPCLDSDEIFKIALNRCSNIYSGRFYVRGIIKPSEDEILISKRANHYIEIGAVSFFGGRHMWGEFGKGFSGLASFHEE